MSEQQTATEFLYSVMRGEVKLAGADRVDIARYLASQENDRERTDAWRFVDVWRFVDAFDDRVIALEKHVGISPAEEGPDDES